ncbi:MAG TPA: TetR/AcrR family transcriptional regulator [Candidatus Binataceae bacterium]|nr:TetR/AcrR family transcriptional regulator [Candidatus Binataceae bacterium]
MKARPRRPARRRASYHHGRLREALIEAALRMVKESGAESVSVREVAKWAGVSSGAPFRHFATRTALMTAVAEQAMGRFRDEIVRALAEAGSDDPLDRFRALGTAYMRWVVRNPAHFEVISNRGLIDFEGSESLRRDNDEIRSLMEELLSEALRRAPLRSDDVKAISFAGRALAYGVARMYIDGHFPQWEIPEREAEHAFKSALDLFVDGVAGGPRSTNAPSSTTRIERGF